MSWGVLVYIVADDRMDAGDSLDEMAGLDLERLRIAAERATIPIAAQIDYQATSGIWRQVFGSTKKQIKRREANSGHPDVLRDFLRWGVNNCDADRYVVMLWGHGSGPGGFFSDASRNTPGRFGHPLSPRQLADALQTVKNDRKKKLEVLLLKACYAATVELAVQLEDTTEFIIGSQSLIPGQTFWPYPRLFQHLQSSAKTNDNEIVADGLLKLLGDFYGNEVNRPGKEEVPYSLLSTAQSKHVAQGLANIVGAWRAADRPDLNYITQRCCPSDPGLLDVARFCQTLMNAGGGPLFDAAADLRNHVDAMVRRRYPVESAFRGVSVFCHPGYRVSSPARDTAPYGVYKRSKLAQLGQPKDEQGRPIFVEPSWIELAFRNTAIAQLSQQFLADKK